MVMFGKQEVAVVVAAAPWYNEDDVATVDLTIRKKCRTEQMYNIYCLLIIK